MSTVISYNDYIKTLKDVDWKNHTYFVCGMGGSEYFQFLVRYESLSMKNIYYSMQINSKDNFYGRDILSIWFYCFDRKGSHRNDKHINLSLDQIRFSIFDLNKLVEKILQILIKDYANNFERGRRIKTINKVFYETNKYLISFTQYYIDLVNSYSLEFVLNKKQALQKIKAIIFNDIKSKKGVKELFKFS